MAPAPEAILSYLEKPRVPYYLRVPLARVNLITFHIKILLFIKKWVCFLFELYHQTKIKTKKVKDIT